MPPSNSGMPMPRWVERFISAIEKWNQSTTKMEKVSQGLRGAMNLPGRIGSALTNLAGAGPLNAVGGGMAKLGAAAAAPAAAATAGLSSAIAPIQAVGQQMAQFVGKANPAIVERFNLALDDAQAVIGQTLAPLFEVMVDLMRMMGDVLKTLQPVLLRITNSLTEVIRAFLGLAEPLTKAFTPILEIVASIIETVIVPAIKLFADALEWLAKKFQQIVQFMVKLINKLIDAINSTKLGRQLGMKRLTEPDSVKMQSSVGAAVRPANYIGLEELGRITSEDAFSLADRPTKGEELIIKELERLNSFVEKKGLLGIGYYMTDAMQRGGDALNRLGVSR